MFDRDPLGIIHCSNCGYDGVRHEHTQVLCQMLTRFTDIEEHTESTDQRMGTMLAILRQIRDRMGKNGSQNLGEKIPAEFGPSFTLQRTCFGRPTVKVAICNRCGAMIPTAFHLRHQKVCV